MATKNTKKTTPFCKVCFEAGKSEPEYTSHFVKSDISAAGVVVCPLLKNTECRYCHTSGHTVKYCSVLKERELTLKHNKRSMKRNHVSAAAVNSQTMSNSSTNLNTPTTVKKNGYFTALNDDSDEEEAADNSSANRIQVAPSTTSSTSSWAAKVAATASVPVTLREPVSHKPMNVQPTDRGDVQACCEMVADVEYNTDFVYQPKKRILNWADYDSDSDDE